MILSSEDIEFIKFSKDCVNKGRYSDANRLTEVWNRCYADQPNFRPVKTTMCGPCIRTRICQIYADMMAALKDVPVENKP